MKSAIHVLIQTSVLCVGIVGCDVVNEYIPSASGKASEAEREQQDRRRESLANQEREEGERSALRLHVQASCKALEVSVEDFRRKSEQANSDRETLSARIRELASVTDESGRTPDRHVVLSGLLDDDKVNEIALRYMERNFRMVRLEFIEAMREANGIAKRRDEALNRSQETYEKVVSGGAGDAEQVRQVTRKSAADIQRAIADLEREEKSLQRSIAMSSAVKLVRDRKGQELREVSRRLRMLQREYDEVRANRQSNDVVMRTAQQVNQGVERAQRLKLQAEAHIARRFAGIKSPAEITSRCEEQTIGELERRIISAGRDSDAVRRRIADCLDYLNSVGSALGGMNQASLKKARADVDARISKASAGR